MFVIVSDFLLTPFLVFPSSTVFTLTAQAHTGYVAIQSTAVTVVVMVAK